MNLEMISCLRLTSYGFVAAGRKLTAEGLPCTSMNRLHIIITTIIIIIIISIIIAIIIVLITIINVTTFKTSSRLEFAKK